MGRAGSEAGTEGQHSQGAPKPALRSQIAWAQFSPLPLGSFVILREFLNLSVLPPLESYGDN